MRLPPGSLLTKGSFGDVQLHCEWATPPAGRGQERGNCGVSLMSPYEIQILDCYHHDTHPDGQAAAVYGQTPPLVNAWLRMRLGHGPGGCPSEGSASPIP
jgi:hypothetical protein